jgi:hypothetical protein
MDIKIEAISGRPNTLNWTTRMGPLDALLHILNFVAPALGVGLFASLLAKLLWRKELRAASLKTLVVWTALVGMGVLVAGLLAFGRDGRMATYGLLVLSTTLVLWWKGFVRPQR